MGAATTAAATAASAVMQHFRNTNIGQGSPHNVDDVSSRSLPCGRATAVSLCSLSSKTIPSTSSKSITSQPSKSSDNSNNHENPQSSSFPTEYFNISTNHEAFDDCCDDIINGHKALEFDNQSQHSPNPLNLSYIDKQNLLRHEQGAILAKICEEETQTAQ